MRPPPTFDELARDLVAARAGWRNRGDPERETMPPGVRYERAGPGCESVWTYPRPPRVEAVDQRASVVLGGVTVADSTRTFRVLETAGAPVYYFPPGDILSGALRETGRWTLCEWKGAADALDVVAGGRTAAGAAWSYRDPFVDLGAGYERIAGYVGFLVAPMDACTLDGELVRPQPGGYYGGWVTDRIVGPIKGGPGSGAW